MINGGKDSLLAENNLSIKFIFNMCEITIHNHDKRPLFFFMS